MENTAGDSFDLYYYGLFMYNVNAMEQLERLDLALESLKKQLFGRLHGMGVEMQLVMQRGGTSIRGNWLETAKRSSNKVSSERWKCRDI